ncbi:MAG: hypothetical protein COC09_09420 [Gammaproteobacteria bacterium]|nr:DUF3999 family protein [Gammaproteobacteria bacterium]PCH62191.1 MAG: hypothetical protein COC09_09420 [Gammaproteobacteria bacterium]
MNKSLKKYSLSKSFIFKQLVLYAGLLWVTHIHAIDVNDFECGFSITEGEQSIRQFTLTEEIYPCLKQRQHTDLAVINNEGQVVPFRLTVPVQVVDRIPYKQSMAFYQEPVISAYKTGDQIRRIAQLTGVTSGSESDKQWQEKHVFYSSLILEKRDNHDRLKSITINSRNGDQPSSTTVVIEASDDLQHWTTLLRPNQLFFLPGSQADLHNNTFNFTVSKASKYLRLAALSNIEDFSQNIVSITGTYERVKNTPPPLQWFTVSQLEPLEKSGEWLLALPDLLPISRIRFTPASNIVFYQGSVYAQPYINSVAEADIKNIRKGGKEKIKELIKGAHKSRSTPEHSWRYLSSFTQYLLQTDTGYTASPEITVTTMQSKRWKFIFEQPQMLQADQLPKIEFGWQPPQITFIAQGSAPFRLVAGSAVAIKRIPFPNHLVFDKSIEAVEILAKITTDKKSSADEEIMPVKTYNWHTLLLWLVLIIGVTIMAVMAYQLAKKMGSDNN